MQQFTRLLLVVALSLVPVSGSFAEEAALPGKPLSAREVLPTLEKGVSKITLSNGLRILHFKRGHAPVFSAQIWVKVGGVNEVTGKTGAAHLLEHMAFKGSEKIGTSDWEREKALLVQYEELVLRVERGETTAVDDLKRVGQELQALWRDDEYGLKYQQRGASGLNAATSKDYTFYMVSLPSTEFEFWCWMESDRLINPVFRQFYKERAVVQEERRMRIDDDPDGRLYEALVATAYWAHPYKLPVIGWPSDLANLHTGDVKELHDRYYRPDNIVIALVGDLDLEKIRPLLEKYFSRLPRGTDTSPFVTTEEPAQRGERRSAVFFDAQPRLIMAYHKPVYPNRDDLYFSVLHSLLSEGRSSLLYRRLVQEKKLASTIDTSEAPGSLYPSLFTVEAMPREGVSNDALAREIQGILDGLKQAEPKRADLEAAKKRVRAGMLSTMTSNYQLASLLGQTELLWGDWQVLFEMYDITISTTGEDVKRLVSTYLNQDNRTYVALEKPRKSEVNGK